MVPLQLELLSQSIKKRAKRRGLTTSLEKMLYANEVALDGLKRAFSKVLCVGVGHGHDVLLNLITSRFETAVGVDPFIEAEGNDDLDYQELLSNINQFTLQHRFLVRRQTIQDFLQNCTDQFDLVVIADVLHHVFQTTQVLSKSPHYRQSLELFKSLRQVCSAYLVVSDVERFGLLPFLHRKRIVKGQVDYTTKQSWQEWDACIRQGGFRFLAKRNYVPYQLRWIPCFLLSGQFGLRTVCRRVYLQYAVIN